MFRAVSIRPFKIDIFIYFNFCIDISHVLIIHPKNNHTLSHTHAHTHAHTHSGYFNWYSLGRGIPQRKTTLTLSRSSELGLSRESDFEGSRVNRHLE